MFVKQNYLITKKEKSKFLPSSFREYRIHKGPIQNLRVELFHVLRNNIGDKDLPCNEFQI
jgi:hypothetical protein